MEERIRVIVAGPGPGAGGPEPSAEVVARALRDAGMEVIYTGLDQTPEQLAATVEQEDADAVGAVLTTEAHRSSFARLAGVLAERGIDDVALFAGGDLADPEDVGWVVPAGADLAEIVGWVRAQVGAAAAR